MLIKLIPTTNDPTILFSLTYGPLPSHLPMPAAYNTLLHNLQTSSPALKIPTSVHALDKTTYLVEVLQEIVFDMSSQSVSCIWVDGGVEEWPLMESSHNGGCMTLLQSVMSDVTDSAKIPEFVPPLPVPTENTQKAKQALPVFYDSIPAKIPQYKKQRSGLLNLVSSFVASSNHGHLSSAPTKAALLCSPLRALPPLSPRDLRRRARSNLVEAYRRYVLPELNARFPAGQGYFGWIARSMLFAAEERLAEMLRQADAPASRSALSILSASSSDEDDDDDARSWSTDTDGSSIHTPIDCHEVGPFVNPIKGTVVMQKQYYHHHQQQQQQQQQLMSPNPIAARYPILSGRALTTYNSLSSHAYALRYLLSRLAIYQERAKEEERICMLAVEIRSRRRAWSSGRLSSSVSNAFRMSNPLQPSRLRMVTTAQDIQVELSLSESVSNLQFSTERERHRHVEPLFFALPALSEDDRTMEEERFFDFDDFVIEDPLIYSSSTSHVSHEWLPPMINLH